jgi:hypothetical protein
VETLFGEKGGAVIKALRNNMPNHLKDKAAWIAEHVILFHQPWLEATINARDMMTHCKDGGFRFEAFVVTKVEKDDGHYIHVPQVEEGMTIREIIEVTWINLLSLVEDFTGNFLGMRVKPEFVIFHGPPSEPNSIHSPWNGMTRENFERLRQMHPDIKKVSN